MLVVVIMAVVILCVVRQRRCRYTSFQFLTRQLMRRASISLTRFAVVTLTIFPVDPHMQCVQCTFFPCVAKIFLLSYVTFFAMLAFPVHSDIVSLLSVTPLMSVESVYA